MTTSIDIEKALNKTQDSLMILKKTLRKLRLEGNFCNLINKTYKNPIANIAVKGERLFPEDWKWGTDPTIQLEKSAKDTKRHFTKEDRGWQINAWKTFNIINHLGNAK